VKPDDTEAIIGIDVLPRGWDGSRLIQIEKAMTPDVASGQAVRIEGSYLGVVLHGDGDLA